MINKDLLRFALALFIAFILGMTNYLLFNVKVTQTETNILVIGILILLRQK